MSKPIKSEKNLKQRINKHKKRLKEPNKLACHLDTQIKKKKIKECFFVKSLDDGKNKKLKSFGIKL